MVKFSKFGIENFLLKSLHEKNIVKPTEIQ